MMEKSELKKRPIIMGAESVRAILDERKTVTRRVVGKRMLERFKFSPSGELLGSFNEAHPEWEIYPTIDDAPYRIGDRVWVKETWAECPDGGCLYKADPMFIGCDKSDFAWDWKSSMFMPRWASRITLEITDIRVERVQDITPEDALKEGFCNYGTDVDTLDAFCEAWQKLNAKRGYPWEKNPWVWVVLFRVVGWEER
jgi:hypothetical protein